MNKCVYSLTIKTDAYVKINGQKKGDQEEAAKITERKESREAD
jgi:hypothetical protein